MKKPLSMLILASNLVIINMLWPLKIRYADWIQVLVGAGLGLICFIILNFALYGFRSKMLIYSSSKSWIGLMAYQGSLLGGYVAYNYTVFEKFNRETQSWGIYTIYLVNAVSASLCIFALTAMENFVPLLKKYPILYSTIWDTEDFFISCLANITASEFFGLAIGFYTVLLYLAWKGIYYVATSIELPYLFIVSLVLTFAASVGWVIVKSFRRKIKSQV
ncbi:hypothetical protein SteCoe_21361 [Stentor coeruleus]|uniref:Uncharacterized protein n=1 Tax=Stentor coeruleus TaxID=5963 RepID=A0A1R2BPW8_9CILI|nr:hypothetical protein SteCoe_21361 [Stentor coeruleus]